MASPNTPTLRTELDALNKLLATIGETPVNSLENPGLLDAVTARNKLHEVSLDTQLKGWNFNTELDYPFTVDGNGNLPLPGNTLGVNINRREYPTMNIVQRGLKLYDKLNHTYTFTQTIKGELIVFLPWDELPEVAKKYITVRAGRLFQNEGVGSELLEKFNEKDEFEALIDLKEAEGRNSEANIFNNSEVSRTLHRSR